MNNNSEWNPQPIDREALRRQLQTKPQELRDILDHLVKQARIEVPDDYDVEAAFADVLSLGAVDAPSVVQPAIVRLALFLYDRLPGKGTG